MRAFTLFMFGCSLFVIFINIALLVYEEYPRKRSRIDEFINILEAATIAILAALALWG